MSRRARLVVIAVWIVVAVVAIVADRSRLLVAAAAVGIVTQLLVLRTRP